MSSFIYTGGCKVLVEKPSLTHAPDICNCSAYYFIEIFGRDKERKICPVNQLWNYKQGGCEDETSVLAKRLCNRKLPWERCSEDTPASVKNQIKNNCIQEGTYSEKVAAQYDDKLPFQISIALPNEAVLGNLELAAAAFVAGFVITLVLTAIILTMCRLPGFRPTSKGSKSLKKVKRNKTKEAVTEGDNVSIQFEDIDEDMNMESDHGYKPMFSGAHLQLQGGAFEDSDRVTNTHRVTTSVNASSSSNTHWSAKQSDPSVRQPPPLPGTSSVQAIKPVPHTPTAAKGRQPPLLPPNSMPVKPFHTVKQSGLSSPGNSSNQGRGPMKLPPRR